MTAAGVTDHSTIENRSDGSGSRSAAGNLGKPTLAKVISSPFVV